MDGGGSANPLAYCWSRDRPGPTELLRELISNLHLLSLVCETTTTTVTVETFEACPVRWSRDSPRRIALVSDDPVVDQLQLPL